MRLVHKEAEGTVCCALDSSPHATASGSTAEGRGGSGGDGAGVFVAADSEEKLSSNAVWEFQVADRSGVVSQMNPGGSVIGWDATFRLVRGVRVRVEGEGEGEG